MINCDSGIFDGPQLLKLLFQYPLSTCVRNPEHEFRFARSGVHLVDVTLTSTVAFSAADLDCLPPPLPRGIPRSWIIKRKIDVFVMSHFGDATQISIHFLRAWLTGVGIFADSVQTLDLPPYVSLRELMRADLKVSPQTSTLKTLSVDFSAPNRDQIHAFYRKFIVSGLVTDLSCTVSSTCSTYDLPGIEKLWQVKALRAGIVNLRSALIDVAELQY